MTIDQFRQLQESILLVQRLALWLHKCSEAEASAEALKLTVRWLAHELDEAQVALRQALAAFQPTAGEAS